MLSRGVDHANRHTRYLIPLARRVQAVPESIGKFVCATLSIIARLIRQSARPTKMGHDLGHGPVYHHAYAAKLARRLVAKCQ
jgi:hypothetical protein